MTDLLIILLIISVWVNIWITLRLVKAIDNTDLSQEDASVLSSKKSVETAQHNLPPQN